MKFAFFLGVSQWKILSIAMLETSGRSRPLPRQRKAERRGAGHVPRRRRRRSAIRRKLRRITNRRRRKRNDNDNKKRTQIADFLLVLIRQSKTAPHSNDPIFFFSFPFFLFFFSFDIHQREAESKESRLELRNDPGFVQSNSLRWKFAFGRSSRFHW